MKIGWIGTGVMGKSMCLHLINAGYAVFIYNRTKNKADGLIEKGAKWLDSPLEVAKNCEIIFTMVGFPGDVQEVILGGIGALNGAAEGTIIVDMSTSEPTLAREIFEKALSKKVHSIDAPVSGGDSGAKQAKLAIMAGGDKNIFEKVLPIFKLMGENISYMGVAGMGQHTKMANQILIASNMIGTIESLLYAFKAGLNQENVLAIVGKGAAASWNYNNLGPKIIKKDFNPGFYIKHFVKDMGIALTESKRMKLSLPGLSMVHQFYISAIALGFENLGTQGLYKVLEKMNGM
jgi:3-hydroxyisobutyrate dehydrogenase